MAPYHKNTKALILSYLVCSPGPVWQKELIEAVGVFKSSGIPALKELRESHKAILVRLYPGNRNLITLKPQVQDKILDGVFWELSRQERSQFLHYRTPEASALPHTGIKPLSDKDLKEIFKTGDNILNLLTPFVYISTVSLLAEKALSPPVVLGDASGVARQDLKELLSRGSSKSSKRPQEEWRLDESLKNNRYREFARKSGFSGKGKTVYVPPPPGEEFNLGDWEPILDASGHGYFCYYEGLPPPAKDLAFAEAWTGQYVRDTRRERESGYPFMISNPTWEAMKNNKYWKAWRRARVCADFAGAKYEDFCEIVSLYFEKHPPRNNKGKILPVSPLHFGGPVARKAYDAGWPERARMDRLRRKEIEKLDSDFLPENYIYPGREKQNRYFLKVMVEIERLADALGAAVDKVINRYVDDKIMSQEFAESQLNSVSPGYRYKKAKTFFDKVSRR